MRIAGREIGPGHPPYLVAEISGEHRGSRIYLHDLMRAAAHAGADAVKLQCFDPEKLAEARGGKDKVLTEGIWKGRTLGDLYQQTHTPREWFPEFFAYARKRGITPFASVFDESDVEFLETLHCAAYKIASPEITCLPLIRKAAETGKPLIISTGMASNQDLSGAYSAGVKAGGAGNLCFLHCTSAYPCPISDANLGKLREMMMLRMTGYGFSDHTIGSTAAIVATALGASIIEKHITLDRSNGGPDASFSLEPKEFAKFVRDIKDAYASLGNGERPASEAPYRDLRRME